MRLSICLAGMWVLLAVISALYVPSARAATDTWDAIGGGTTFDGSGTWSTASSNWWNSSTDTVWTNSNTAVFGATPGSNPYTVTLGSNVTAAGITFASQNYTVAGGGNTLNIGSGGITGNASATVSAPVMLGASQVWISNSGSLTVSGSVALGSNTLTITGGGSAAISGNVSGAGGILASGVAPSLFGNNAYGGSTLINGGTLQIGGGSSSIGPITVGNSAGAPASLIVNAGALSTSGGFTMGNAANTVASYTQNGGSVTLTGATALVWGGPTALATTASFTLNGGSFTVSTSAAAAANMADFGTLIYSQTAGTFTYASTSSNLIIGVASQQNGETAAINVSGGTYMAVGNSFGLFNLDLGQRETGTLNVSGSGFVDLGNLSLTRSGAIGADNTGNGVVNLTGGSLEIFSLVKGSATTGSTGSFYFNGGMLLAGTNNTAWIPNNATMAVYVQNGGAIINTNGFNVTVSQPLLHYSGAATDSLTKLGAGVLTLSASSSYAGGVFVNAGTLQLGNSAALGGGGLAANGGTLDLNGFSVAVPSFSGAAGTITDNNAGAGTTTLTVNQGINSTFAGSLANGPNKTLAMTKGGTGMLTLNGVNTFGGATTLTAGTLAVNGSLAAGSNVSVGAATLAGSGLIGGNVTLAGGAVNLSGGTIGGTLSATSGNFNGVGTVSGQTAVNGSTFTIGSGANLIALSGLNVAGGGLAGAGTISGTMNYTSPAASNFPGSIVGGGNSLILNNSAAVLTLGGSNTYTGTTNVLAGVLLVNGAHSGGDAYSIAPGATLGGMGTISGTNTVTLASGGAIAPGPLGGAGTLTLPGLATGGGATLSFALSNSASTGNDLLNVAGNVSLGGTTVISANLIDFALASGSPYSLIDYSGTLTNSSGSSALALAPGVIGSRQSAVFNYGTGANSAITMTITGFNAQLTWVGTSSTTWVDNTAVKSWTSPTSPAGDFFTAGDFVTFNNTGGTNTAVTVSGNVTPSSITVTGRNNYVFSGTGSIAGSPMLTVAGPGSLTIATSGNSYTGGTAIQGGLLALGANNALPAAGLVTLGLGGSSGTLDLAGNSQTVGGLAVGASASAASQILTASTGNSTLTFNNTTGSPSVFYGAIRDTATTTSGTLGLTVSAGTLDVSGGATTYYGATTVNGGLLLAGPLPNSSGVFVGPSGALTFPAAGIDAPAISNSGSVNFTAATGTTTAAGLTGPGTATFNSPAAQIGVLGSSTVNLNGTALSVSAGTQTGSIIGSGSLTIAASANLTLAGANSYGGGTTLAGGWLNIDNNSALGSGTLTITGGTIDSTVAGIALANIPQNWNGDFTFNGTNSLNLGGGAVTLGGSRNVTVNGSTLTVGPIGDGGSGFGLTKAGTGTLTLAGADSYGGGTTIVQGTLQVGAAGAIPTGASTGNVVFTATGNTAVLDLNGTDTTINGLWQPNASTTNMVVNNLSGTNTLTAGNNNASSTFAGVLANNSGTGGFLALQKIGTGTLTLAGNNNYSGSTSISAGALQIGGGSSSIGPVLVGNSAGGSSLVVNGGFVTINGGFALGTNAASVASYTQNGGAVTLTGANQFVWASVTGGTANFTLNGGSYTVQTTATVAPSLGSLGVLIYTQSGGTFTYAANASLNANIATSSGAGGVTAGPSTLNISGGSFVVVSSSATPFDFYLGQRAMGTLNISSNAFADFQNLSLTRGGGIGGDGSASGTVNLSGGTLEAASVSEGFGGSDAGTTGTVNFNGGMLLAASNNAAWIPNNSQLTLNVQNGGAIINTNGFNVTIAQPLLHYSGATSDGLTVLGGGVLTLTSTNSYAGETFVNGGTLNVNAPSSPTGALGTSSLVLVNSGAAITVAGNNALVGDGTSPTPTATIQINAGGAVVSPGGSTAHLGALVLNGGTLAAAFSNPTYGNWDFDYGVSTPGNGTTSYIIGGNAALTQAGGTTFNVGASDTLIVTTELDHVGFTPPLLDSGLIKSGSGTLVLTAPNTYQSPTTINAGILVAGALNTLPAGSDVFINGGTLDVTAAPQTINSLTVGMLGTLNLNASNLITSLNAATFSGGTLNISAATGAGEIMAYGSYGGGTFAYVTGLPGGDSLAYNGNQLDIVSGAPTTWVQGSGNWSAGTNWSTGSKPNAPGAGALLNQSNSGTVAITLDVPVTLGSLQFASSTTNYAVSGNTLTFNNNGGTSSVTVTSGTHSIGSLVVITSGNLDIAASSNSVLTINGNIADDGLGRSLTLGGDGTGQLVLSGANTYGGGTIVDAGTLVVDSASALLDGSSLTVGQGASSLFAPVAGPVIAAVPSGVVAVPEPGTIMLLLAALGSFSAAWVFRMSRWSAMACHRFSKRPSRR